MHVTTAFQFPYTLQYFELLRTMSWNTVALSIFSCLQFVFCFLPHSLLFTRIHTGDLHTIIYATLRFLTNPDKKETIDNNSTDRGQGPDDDYKQTVIHLPDFFTSTADL